MTKEEQFETFWRAYPRRISKGSARTAFAKAIGKTTLDTMLSALVAYVANKPSYQDYKHPSTWLNGECWDDEWTVPVAVEKFERKRTLADAAEDLGRYFGNADGLGYSARH
jgi:phosphopantetheinyl transferase